MSCCRSTSMAEERADPASGAARDCELELAHAAHARPHPVAGGERPDAGRRAGEHEVARQQTVEGREGGQHLVDAPDHLGEVALLPYGTVHLEPDPAAARVP